jgi:hypothetical protein
MPTMVSTSIPVGEHHRLGAAIRAAAGEKLERATAVPAISNGAGRRAAFAERYVGHGGQVWLSRGHL